MDSSNTQRQLVALRVMLHLTGTLGFAALLIAAWSFLIRPIEAQRRVTSQRMAELDTTLVAAEEIREENALLSQRLSADREQEAALKARIPDDPAEAEFLALASELAAETGLEIQDYRPNSAIEDPSCSSLEVELICEGDYASVCGFLDGMSRLPRLSRVKRLHIDSTKGKEDYSIEISVLLYFATSPDPAAVEGAEPNA